MGYVVYALVAAAVVVAVLAYQKRVERRLDEHRDALARYLDDTGPRVPVRDLVQATYDGDTARAEAADQALRAFTVQDVVRELVARVGDVTEGVPLAVLLHDAAGRPGVPPLPSDVPGWSRAVERCDLEAMQALAPGGTWQQVRDEVLRIAVALEPWRRQRVEERRRKQEP
ncbi:hypothetical protein [Thalassiella azotivora]